MILYPVKLLVKIDGGIKVFHEKKKLKQICDYEATIKEDTIKNSAQKMKANKTTRE
jgi:hypothetical protein